MFSHSGFSRPAACAPTTQLYELWLSITSQIAVFDMHYFVRNQLSVSSRCPYFYHNHPSSDFSYDEHVKSSLCLSLFNTDAFDLLPPDRRDNETSQTFPRDTDTDK